MGRRPPFPHGTSNREQELNPQPSKNVEGTMPDILVGLLIGCAFGFAIGYGVRDYVSRKHRRRHRERRGY